MFINLFIMNQRICYLLIFLAALSGSAIAATCPVEFPDFAPHPDTFGVGCAAIPSDLTVEITRQPSNGKISFFDTDNDGIQDELLFFSTIGDGKPVGAPSDFGYNLKRADGSLVLQDALAVVPANALNFHSEMPCSATTVALTFRLNFIYESIGGGEILPESLCGGRIYFTFTLNAKRNFSFDIYGYNADLNLGAGYTADVKYNIAHQAGVQYNNLPPGNYTLEVSSFSPEPISYYAHLKYNR